MSEKFPFEKYIGGHITLDNSVPEHYTFQCYLTSNRAHYTDKRIDYWKESGIHFKSDSKRIVHASYVTYPWSEKDDTYHKSIEDIKIGSECANVVGIQYFLVHLSKEYHFAKDFPKRVSECLKAIQQPCILIFELVGSSTKLVSEGKLPQLPVDRLYECSKVIENVNKGLDWGFCLDTAHLFIQGQPLTTYEDVENLIKSSKRFPVKAIHFNGSKWGFKSGRDEHAVISSNRDNIWSEDDSGVYRLLKWIEKDEIPSILERPSKMRIKDHKKEMEILRNIYIKNSKKY